MTRPSRRSGEPDQRRSDDLPPRARSLLITLWGDVLVPHGTEFWLSTVIDLAAALGINPRLLRTTIFRLSEEDWLVGTRIGRASRYRLTENGERRVAHADARIYQPSQRHWDGQWTLVLAEPTLSGSRRAALRDELGWQGFGEFAPGLYAHPGDCDRAVSEILASTRTRDAVTLLKATAPASKHEDALHGLTNRAFDLDALALRYRVFIDRFAPALEHCRDLAGAGAFALRVQLVHAYRRVLLHDPQLPSPLLPDDWPGHRAFTLARQLYASVLQGSEGWIGSILGDDSHPALALARLATRFPASRV